MSTQETVQIEKNVFPAVGRGDEQDLLATSAEQIDLIESSRFRDDVLRGLSGSRRSVPSRWLHDDRGSELFEDKFRRGDTIHTESSRKYDAESFARLAELGGWRVAELWTDAERLFAVVGLAAATPAKGV